MGDTMQRRSLSDLAVFILLVAIAIVGRHERIDWNFTPIVAATLFAGYYFRRAWIAVLVPIAALVVSDWREPSHVNGWVMATVWMSFAAVAMLGPWLRRAEGFSRQIGRGALAAFAPSAVFFLTTNLVVWLTEYPLTLANLGLVYLQAIPFYRNMVMGDLFYIGLFFGAYALAAQGVGRRATLATR